MAFQLSHVLQTRKVWTVTCTGKKNGGSRDTHGTRGWAHKDTRNTQTNLTTIQTHQYIAGQSGNVSITCSPNPPK